MLHASPFEVALFSGNSLPETTSWQYPDASKGSASQPADESEVSKGKKGTNFKAIR